MIRLTVDGKDFSCENVDVLINYEYITEKTEICSITILTSVE